VNKQEFGASIWRSSQGYTKMHGQPTIKTTQLCLIPPSLTFCIVKNNIGSVSIYNFVPQWFVWPSYWHTRNKQERPTKNSFRDYNLRQSSLNLMVRKILIS